MIPFYEAAQKIDSVSPTRMIVGMSAFISLNPVPNQVGVMFFGLTSGATFEIAGGGYSSAGFGTSYVLINTGNKSINGAVNLSLMPNGMGFPITPQSAGYLWQETFTFWGQPTIWFTSGGATSTVAVLYLKNSIDGS